MVGSPSLKAVVLLVDRGPNLTQYFGDFRGMEMRAIGNPNRFTGQRTPTA